MNRMPVKRPELLVPAGSPEVLTAAVHYGADAVYFAGGSFGLRARARNFSEEELAAGIGFAHGHGVKAYIAVNILAHNEDIGPLRDYLQRMNEWRPDGLIIADPGVFMLAGEICPDIPRHISTQANNTNYETCRFWAAQGAARIVAARELSLGEIRELRKKMPEELELECFVHGAMCISYSGRCLLSSFLSGRDANRGACAHPCRWQYSLLEEKRPGEYFPVTEDERGTYIFNSKDLCMIGHIPELIGAGIDSFKIEGRMKTALYVATVTRAYRQAVDTCLQDPEAYRRQLPLFREEAGRGTNRQFTTGFYFGKPTEEDHVYDSSAYVTSDIYIGMIREVDAGGRAVFIQKNKFSAGDTLEILRPDGSTPTVTVRGIWDAAGNAQPSAPHACQELHVDLGVVPHVHDVLRMRAAAPH